MKRRSLIKSVFAILAFINIPIVHASKKYFWDQDSYEYGPYKDRITITNIDGTVTSTDTQGNEYTTYAFISGSKQELENHLNRALLGLCYSTSCIKPEGSPVALKHVTVEWRMKPVVSTEEFTGKKKITCRASVYQTPLKHEVYSMGHIVTKEALNL